MANPITWRNVESRSDSGAAALLEGARQSINAGTDAFRKELTGLESTIDANYANDGKNNARTYLDKLASFRTVGDLEAGRGELDALAQSLGPNIDPAVTRDGFDNRLGALRTDETAAYNYEQTNLDREVEPLLEEIKSLAVTDPAGARAMADANMPQLTAAGVGGDLLQKIYDRDRTLESDARADVLSGFAEDKAVREYTATKQAEFLDQQMTSLLDGGVDSAVMAGQQAFRLAADNGIPVSIATAAAQKARDTFKVRNGFDDEQVEGLRQISESGQNQLLKENETIDRVYQDAVDKYDVDDAYTFREGLQSLPSAESVATTNGWDPSNAADRINEARIEFIAENPSLTDRDNPDTHALNMVSTLMNYAVTKLGKVGDNTFSFNDLPKDKVKKLLQEQYDAYRANQTKVGKLREHAKIRDEDKAKAREAYSALVNGTYNHMRSSNINSAELRASQTQ